MVAFRVRADQSRSQNYKNRIVLQDNPVSKGVAQYGDFS
jgi:hypothetical protein